MPSVAERIPEAQNCGISDYTGTSEQNIAFEDCLRSGAKINEPNFFSKLRQANSEAGIFGAINFVQVQDMYLSGSGITSSATSITLDQFKYPNGDLVVMSDFGSVGYGTLEPDTTREENIKFTGISQLGSGKATLTGVTRGLGLSAPYTASSTLQFAHAGGTLFRITNSAPFYAELLAKQNNEYVDGVITYNVLPVATSTIGTATTTYQFVTKQYVDNVVNQGAATSTETVAGIAELATQLQMASSTDLGANDPLVLQAKYATSTPSANRGLFVPVAKNNGYLSQLWFDLTEYWDFNNIEWTNSSSSKATTTQMVIGSSNPAGNNYALWIGGNSTSTGTFDLSQLCFSGSGCSTNIGNRLLYASSTTLGRVQSTSVTTVFTVPIPANYLTGTRQVVGKIPFYGNPSGGRAYDFSIWSDGTLIATSTVTYGNATGTIDIIYGAKNASNLQSASMFINANSSDSNAVTPIIKYATGDTAIDMTAATNLLFKVSIQSAGQFNYNNAWFELKQ